MPRHPCRARVPGACAVRLRRPQAFEQRRVGADAEDDAVVVVALAEHLAGGEDLAAQLLAVVGDAQLPLDQIAARRTR